MNRAVVRAMAVVCLAAFAQVWAKGGGAGAADADLSGSDGAKPKIAVYVSEYCNYSDEEKSALRMATLNTLVRSRRYDVIERSNVIDMELAKQADGSVDDDQLTAFGRQSGAQFVCVADMVFLRKWVEDVYCSNKNGDRYKCGTKDHFDYQVSARVIDVETAEVMALGVVEYDILNGSDMSTAVVGAVLKMLSTKSSRVETDKDVPKLAVYVQGGKSNHNVGNAVYTYVLEGPLYQEQV